VYTTGAGFVTVNAGNDVMQCGYLDDGSPAHGCLLDPWVRDVPLATIYMYLNVFANGDSAHKQSDLMHEMGHVLYHAGEHYGTTYNCQSIMGHCNSPRITSV